MEILGVPPRYKPKIIRRWNAAGAPPFCEFAPYAAHILTCSPTSPGGRAISQPRKIAGSVSPALLTAVLIIAILKEADGRAKVTELYRHQGCRTRPSTPGAATMEA